MGRRRLAALLTSALVTGLLVGAVPASDAGTPDTEATAVVETTPAGSAGDTVDDMAIWVNPADPAGSLVIGADHSSGELEVYDLAGERLSGVRLPDANNVDLRTGFMLGGASEAIVGVAGGGSTDGRLTFFRINAVTRQLENVTVGGSYKVPSANGFCMYHSAVSGKFYAFRTTPAGKVQQY
ncbi:MAG: phytase, partial [Acidimicrobiia bacterium]